VSGHPPPDPAGEPIPVPVLPARQPARVLDYLEPAAPAPRWLPSPARQRQASILVAVLCVLMSYVGSAGNIPFPIAAAFGGMIGFMVRVLFLAWVEWAVPTARLLQFVASALLYGVTCFVICSRAGESGASWGATEYWSTYNQGYRFGPEYALRPWWLAVVGLAWFLTVLVGTFIGRRRGPATFPSQRSFE
jgi:hypothetical protein